METKIQKEFVDHGFGFPVKLKDVTMVKVRGAWTPKVDYQAIAKQLLVALAFKSGRLTGAEVRFIRQAQEMTLQEFGRRFDVSHVAVLKWEKTGIKPTAMSWAVEKDLRLFSLRAAGASSEKVGSLYAELDAVREGRGVLPEIRPGRAA